MQSCIIISFKFSVEDSHGKETSGRTRQRDVWYGEYDQCYDIKGTIPTDHGEEDYSGFYVIITSNGKRPDFDFKDKFSTGFCATPRCKNFMKASVQCKYRDNTVFLSFSFLKFLLNSFQSIDEILNETCGDKLSYGQFKLDNEKLSLTKTPSLIFAM